MITRKSIATAIILSIVTCGIYGLYWLYQINDSVAQASGIQRMSGGVVLLLEIITCGLYGIYWAYIMGKDMQEAQARRNMPITDNSILYLVLSIFGLQIVNLALIQNDLNNMPD